MRFGQETIPGSLFKLARDKIAASKTFTPEDVRRHLAEHGRADLVSISSIETNQRIVAERVMRAVIKELVLASEIRQLKRGVWAKTEISAQKQHHD